MTKFEVPVLVLDARALVGDNLDAGVSRLFQHGLQRLLVVRHDANDVDFFAIRSSIARTCKAGSALVGPIMDALTPSFGAVFLDALLHGVEPRNAADLHDNAHRGLVGGESARGEHGGESGARQQGASGCREVSS